MSTPNDNALPGLPACCYASPTDPLAKKMYATYNRAGARKGLNYQGLPCPLWEELPEDVRAKWEAVAEWVF